LALFNFGTQGLQNLGLITTESARVSFLVQLSVVITPVLAAFMGNKTHPKVWVACFVALLGLYILSNTGAQGLFSVRLTTGDLCCLGSAFCWSYYIYRMSAWGDYFDETLTQFYKNIMLASMYAVWMCISMALSDVSLWEGWRDPVSWLLLFYSALGPCTIADIIQQKAQASVPAAESNVILSLEPVFTAILGVILLGEILSWQELVGGSLIIVASILASY
jgi:drug/metabolite transporter (DMT)-like permease